MSVHSKHTRKKVQPQFNYGRNIAFKLLKAGLGADHDNGHRGAAKTVREAKTHDRRKRRHAADQQLKHSMLELMEA